MKNMNAVAMLAAASVGMLAGYKGLQQRLIAKRMLAKRKARWKMQCESRRRNRR